MSETGYSEPPAKVSLPAGGTWKPLEASRGCSWSRIFAEFANQPLPHASGVALGRPQEPPTCGLRAAWAAIWGTPPKSPRRPPGRHFGPLGVRFCSLRESIFEAAQDPARGLQGASGDPFWDNIKSMLDPSGAHCSFSWSSRASQFWQDLAAKTPQHQARQGRPRPA